MRLITPTTLALLSTALSVAAIAVFGRNPASDERASAALVDRLRAESSTTERAAENFYYALGKNSLRWAVTLSCGRERRALTRLGVDHVSQDKSAPQLENNPIVIAGTYPYLVFRESVDLSGDCLALTGIARRQPNDTAGVTVHFIVNRANRRWCVELFSSETGNFP